MKVARHFTPEEANRTLPLVRQIVEDILEIGRQVRALSQTKPVDEETIRLKVQKLERLVAELEQIGCYFKDWNFDAGLVDFPAVVNGKEVLLCWRSDEAAITHYHGYDDGYAGRKPLPLEKAML
jgi:hypothetical protein